MTNFYTVSNIAEINTGKEYIYFIALNKNHPVYNGHFPQQAVVPGVCMVQIIRELTEKACSRKLQYSNINNIKFLSIVVPDVNNQLNIKLNIDNNPEAVGVKAIIEFENKIFLNLKGTLTSKNVLL